MATNQVGEKVRLLPDILTKEQKSEIRQKILARGGAPCPRCGGEEFGVIDGFVNLRLNSGTETASSKTTQFVPTVATVCMKCAHIAFHSAFLLDLSWLPQRHTAPSNEGGR